jgi:putative transposase
VRVNGKLCYLWRAVDHEGEVLEAVVTSRRDKAAALKLFAGLGVILLWSAMLRARQ